MNKIFLLLIIIIFIFLILYLFNKHHSGVYDYSCKYKRYGCCPDGLLPKNDYNGTNCH